MGPFRREADGPPPAVWPFRKRRVGEQAAGLNLCRDAFLEGFP